MLLNTSYVFNQKVSCDIVGEINTYISNPNEEIRNMRNKLLEEEIRNIYTDYYNKCKERIKRTYRSIARCNDLDAILDFQEMIADEVYKINNVTSNELMSFRPKIKHEEITNYDNK